MTFRFCATVDRSPQEALEAISASLQDSLSASALQQNANPALLLADLGVVGGCGAAIHQEIHRREDAAREEPRQETAEERPEAETGTGETGRETQPHEGDGAPDDRPDDGTEEDFAAEAGKGTEGAAESGEDDADPLSPLEELDHQRCATNHLDQILDVIGFVRETGHR